jgi:hypothetical protein
MDEDLWAAHIAAMLLAGMIVTVICGFGTVGALLIGVLFSDIILDG